VYDVRASTTSKENPVEIVYKAAIQQSTGEVRRSFSVVPTLQLPPPISHFAPPLGLPRFMHDTDTGYIGLDRHIHHSRNSHAQLPLQRPIFPLSRSLEPHSIQAGSSAPSTRLPTPSAPSCASSICVRGGPEPRYNTGDDWWHFRWWWRVWSKSLCCWRWLVWVSPVECYRGWVIRCFRPIDGWFIWS
jgi:hypothetical protein